MMDILILDETHILYEGKAQRVHFRGREGEFEVAQNHAPVLSLLKKGTIHIKIAEPTRKGETRNPAEGFPRTSAHPSSASFRGFFNIPIERGIMKMEQNRVLVMVEM